MGVGNGDGMEQPQIIPEATDAVSHAHSAALSFTEGQVVGGRYKIISACGQGGIGVVYRVEQIFLGKLFAFKTLDTSRVSEVTVKRFQQEARAASALDHPNLIKVQDYGLLDDDTPFLVMDLIEGPTLAADLKRKGTLPLQEVVPLFANIALGLGYAHDNGVVHRDIKPSNIMLMRPDGIVYGEGDVKVVDFGIAKLAQHEGGEIQALTRTGEIFGSPLYMSPEQCMGLPVDHRSDIYSLGCVLYEALTGAPPFIGDTALATMMKHQTDEPAPLRESTHCRDCPAELEQIVAKMLAKHPEDRYQQIGLVAHDLTALYRGDSSMMHADGTVKKPGRVFVMPPAYFAGMLAGIAAFCFLAGFLLAGGWDRLLIAVEHFRKAASEGAVKSPSEEASSLPGETQKVDQADTSRQPAQIPESKDAQPPESSQADSAASQSAGFDSQYPTSRNVTVGGVKMIRFHFPELVGYIRNTTIPTRGQRAEGTIDFPADAWIGLDVDGTVVERRPDLLSKLQPGRIVLLNMTRSDGTIVKPAIRHLTSLSQVDFEDLDVDDSIIEELNQLPLLGHLVLSHSYVTAAAVAQLKRLPVFWGLDVSGIRKPSESLVKMKGSKTLTVLGLNDCDLSDADMSAIGTMTGLAHLNIGRNPSLTDAGLQNLTKLKQLKVLTLTGVPATPATARIICQLHNLKYLKVSFKQWGDSVKLLPKTIQVTNDDPKTTLRSEVPEDEVKQYIFHE